ncbi:hypothetical protein EVA_08646 [gut metagenome]|uniref:Uncharacterized protein n=1 Tax=gut metagenome TaxID=749906 RepID=J9G7M6_9ZZZZ
MLISSAATPYASSCFAPPATPCKSNGVFAAVVTSCLINSSAFSLLPSIVLKATSSC